jgi:AcrR family transcriptional regulator
VTSNLAHLKEGSAQRRFPVTFRRLTHLVVRMTGASGAGPVQGRYHCLPRGKHGLTPYAVMADQQERLFRSLMSLIADRGYTSTNLVEIAAQAHVSRITIKEMLGFSNKEDCFVWALDSAVNGALAATRAAYLGEGEWTGQLRGAFTAFVEEVREQPEAARAALIESFGAGAKAVELVEDAAGEFERMMAGAFAASPEQVVLPPLIAKGIVGGVARVVRQALLEGRTESLPGMGDELLAWTLSYHSQAGAQLVFRSMPQMPPAVQTATEDERSTLARAAVLLAAQSSYPRLRAEAIVRRAGLPRDALDRHFPDGVAECFKAGVDALGREVAAEAQSAARLQQGEWPARVIAGLRSILGRIAQDRTFERVAFVEVFGAGSGGAEARREIVSVFGGLLTTDIPDEFAPSPLVTEAIVGAVWQLAHHAVWRGAAGRLPSYGDFASYLVLAPLLGADGALREINAGC